MTAPTRPLQDALEAGSLTIASALIRLGRGEDQEPAAWGLARELAAWADGVAGGGPSCAMVESTLAEARADGRIT